MVATKFAAIPIVFAATSPAFAVVASLDCSTTQVVITNGKSSRAGQEFHFKLDDSAKTIAFADGTRLGIIRFDNAAISAEHDDMRYDINRVDYLDICRFNNNRQHNNGDNGWFGSVQSCAREITRLKLLHRRTFFSKRIQL